MASHDPKPLIDWEGLSKGLDSLNTKWTPIPGGPALDIEGFSNALDGYLIPDDNRVSFKTGINVEFTGDGTPWYEAIAGAVGTSADWVADKLFIAAAGPILGLGLILLDEAGKNPGVLERRARDKLKSIRAGEDVYDPLDFMQIPIGSGSIPLGDIFDAFKGIPEGVAQNIELITGGRADTYRDRIDKQELAGFKLLLDKGEITKEDFDEYVTWLTDRDNNIPVAREIGAGITNSLLIMGELILTKNIAVFTTRGLKMFSRAWIKAWGKGILQQGINTWKLMGAGATIKSLGDASIEAKDAKKRGEDHTFWDFSADLGMNLVKNNIQAIAEGASEGVLLGMRMGSVNLGKWLGKGVLINGETKYLGIKGLKRLINATTDKTLKKTYQTALRNTIADRKQIAKQLAKNFGNKLVQGLGIETATEQITDAVQDIFEADSHSSAIWILFGDQPAKQEALRNLIVEMAVGTSLGFGLGVGDVWSRKILQEIEDEYGKDIANTVETTLAKSDPIDLAKAIKNAQKTTTPENVTGRREATISAVIQEQGSGQVTKIVETSEDKELMDIIKLNSPSIIKRTMDIVDDLQDPNILDYTFQQGKQEIISYLKLISQADSKKDATEEGENVGHLNYNLNSYMMDASPEAIHSVMEVTKNKLVGEAITNGLMKRINWTTGIQQAPIRSDLAVGIMLNFDEEGWAFLKHKYRLLDDVDFLIEEAKTLQQSDIMIVPNNDKIIEHKTIGELQAVARNIYMGSIMSTIGLIIAQKGFVESADIGITEDLADIETTVITDGIVDVQVIKEDEADFTDLGDFITGEEDILPQTAPSINNIEVKAKRIARIIGIDYIGFQAFPSTSGSDDIILGFRDPLSKRDIKLVNTSLTYKKLLDETILARGGTPMAAVAFRYKDQIIERGLKHTHASLANVLYEEGQMETFWNDYVGGVVESGMIDVNGKFYTEEEIREATGLEGESFTQGVSDTENGLLFESGLPDLTFKLPDYGRIINDFKGNTIADLVQYFIDKDAVNKETLEIAEKLLPIIGQRGAKIIPMDPANPGGTSKTTLAIQLNPKATLWNLSDPWDTLTHEMLHSFLHGFMSSDTQAAGIFNGKIGGVLNTVKAILNADPESSIFKTKWKGNTAELQAWKKDHISLIRKSLQSKEEFITAVISDTQNIKWITDRIEMGGPKTKITGWRRIWQSIRDALATLNIRRSATQELQNLLERQSKIISSFNKNRDREFSPRATKEHKRLAKNITSGYEDFEYNNDNDNNDQLDPEQVPDDIPQDDENQTEAESIENFTRFTSVLFNVPEGELRSNIRAQAEFYPGADGFNVYLDKLDKLDEANSNIITRKLQNIYSKYRSNFKAFEDFKRTFLKRQWLNVVFKTAKDGYVFMGINEFNAQTGQQEYSYQMRKVKGSFRDGNGKIRNTYRRDIALESYIPAFEELLGLPSGTFTVAYIEGFETWNNGRVIKRSSLDGLSPQVFGATVKDGVPITGYLADALWESTKVGASKDGLLYLGSFAGKNTLPILAFNANDKAKIRTALFNLEAPYLKQVKEEFEGEYGDQDRKNPVTEARRMAAISRVLLEDLWFGDKKTIIKDFNKTMKRSPKWYAANTGAVINIEEIENEFGNAPLNGIRFTDNDVIINAMIVSSKDDTIISHDLPNGKHIELPLNILLQNKLGTSTIDGATFYIIGHFDKIYRIGHGILKDGGIKNVYASRAGEDPLFIKHAMHGVTGDSILGQWMLQHNAAMLISDEALKEGPEDKIVGAVELMNTEMFKEKNPLIELKLSQFTRISESEYKDKLGGSTKQLANGTAFSDLYNDIVKGINKSGISLNQIMKDFTSAQSQEAVKWFQENTTPEALYDLLKDIVYNPSSPQEK